VSSGNRTTKVCKHFIEAVEKSKYGWFWVCPNGGKDCKYRHALPPGFILERDRKSMKEAEDDDEDYEEKLEAKRGQVFFKGEGTPVN